MRRKIAVTKCVKCPGLNFNEAGSNAVPSAKHSRLLAGYLLNLKKKGDSGARHDPWT
jgi:hypothetical protein